MNRFIAIGACLVACAPSRPPDPRCATSAEGFSLTGLRSALGVDLSWTDTGAQGWQVDATVPSAGKTFRNPVASTTEPHASLTWDVFADVLVEVHAVYDHVACAEAAGSLQVPPPVALSGEANEDGVLLTWNNLSAALGSPATVFRGPDADHVAAIAQTEDGFYLDLSVTDLGTYAFAVQVMDGRLTFVTNPVTVLTLAPAPVVSTASRIGGVQLSWQAAPGYDSCTVNDAPGTNGATLPCATEESCTYQVRCKNGEGRSTHVRMVRAIADPPAPVSCSARTGSVVRVDWNSNTPTVGFRIDRLAPGEPDVTLATVTAQDTFVDDAAPPFQRSSYRVTAVAPDGNFDPAQACVTGTAFGISGLDAHNVAPAQANAHGVPGQTFTVQQGGQLMGIELPAMAPVNGLCLQVTSLDDPQGMARPPVCASIVPGGLSAPLDLDRVVGNYYDLADLHLLVSANEKLRFELVGPEVLMTSAETYGGGDFTSDGVADSGHDLIFKTYVQPSSALPAPVLNAEGATAPELLSWTASPGALGYDVLDASGAVMQRTQNTSVTIVAPDGGQRYRVRANGANGASAVSNEVSVLPPALLVTAANLCATGGALVFIDAGSISQTVTVEHTGLLSRLDLAAQANGQVLRVEDVAAGTPLAELTFASPLENGIASFSPLSPSLLGTTSIDLGGLNLHFTAGEQLRFVIQGIGSPDIALLDSADGYAGGSEDRSAARDLCFKVYVDPTR